MLEKIPYYVKRILEVLTSEGHEAYLVGGGVRDLLLGIPPKDFDICTNAVPETVVALAENEGWLVIDKLGQNLGVVLVSVDENPIEIATFRKESYYGNSHRPDEVSFCKTLEEDLSRRDFTVNAMALDLHGNLYDYFDGQEDLKNKTLRTVGNPKERYAEDPLRMFRACRFVGQLGFDYQGNKDYSEFDVEKCKILSLDRIKKEVDKLLVTEHARKGLDLLMKSKLVNTICNAKIAGVVKEVALLPELAHLENLPQNARFHCFDAWQHTLVALENSSPDLVIRWSLLLHDIGKGTEGVRKINDYGQPSDHGHEAISAKMAKEILTRLEYSDAFIKRVVWVIAQHMRFAPMLFTKQKTLYRWVRAEANSGNFKSAKELGEGYAQLKDMFLADMGATIAGYDNPKLMAEARELGDEVELIAKEKMPVHTSDLDIRGRDLEELLATKPDVSIRDILEYLLKRVQNGELENKLDVLLSAVKQRLERL